MSKHDLQAKPIYHRKREAAGWSIRKFVRTARRYRTIEIQADPHTITAADSLPADLRQALKTITRAT
jgi:hypothetical protein